MGGLQIIYFFLVEIIVQKTKNVVYHYSLGAYHA